MEFVTTEARDVELMREACKLAWLSNAVESAYCVGCVITTTDRSTILSTGTDQETLFCAMQPCLKIQRVSKRRIVYWPCPPVMEYLPAPSLPISLTPCTHTDTQTDTHQQAHKVPAIIAHTQTHIRIRSNTHRTRATRTLSYTNTHT